MNDTIMTPAQRAAATRKARREGGATGTTPATSTGRKDGADLVLVVKAEGDALVASLTSEAPDLLGDHERGVVRLCWRAEGAADGSLTGFDRATVEAGRATAADLRDLLRVMDTLDGAIEGAGEDGFVGAMDAVARVARATAVRVEIGAKPVTAKPGVAAIIALAAAVEAFVSKPSKRAA